MLQEGFLRLNTGMVMVKPLVGVLELSSLPMAEQREKLRGELNAWHGSVHQTDNVCVMGVRIAYKLKLEKGCR